jgi:hypothetical protein
LRNFGSHKSTDVRRVKRTLFHHFILTETPKNKYKKGGLAEKKSYVELLRGRSIVFRKEMGFYSGTRTIHRRGCLAGRLWTRMFLERDDNSRITAGIRETVSKNKIKKQRRILLSTLERLHHKFILENSDVNISYTSFCRLRPFWVTHQKSLTEKPVCKQHDNIQFLANTLFKKKLIKTANLHDLVKTFSCNIQNIFCMYGQCQACKDVRIPLQNIDQNETVSWFKWQTVKERE